MPDNSLPRAEIIASITQGQLRLYELRSETQETVARTRETITQTLELIAQADRLLARQ